MSPVHWTVSVIAGFALVGRAGQDADDRALRPAAPTPLARRDAALDQPLLDCAGAQLLLDEPAVDLAHHRRLTFLNSHLLRAGLGPAEQAIAVVRRAAPVDPSLAGLEQAPPPGPLRDQGAFVFGKDALHLQQHLLLRAVAEGVVEEHHLTAGALELIDCQHLVGIVARQAVRGTNQHGGTGALSNQVTHPVEAGASQRCAAATVLGADQIGSEGNCSLWVGDGFFG